VHGVPVGVSRAALGGGRRSDQAGSVHPAPVRHLCSSQRPPTAHIARAETTDAGEELEIFRRSVPYGTATEYGLYFVAFSAERARYDRILSPMLRTAHDGLRDRLTDFSRPVSGAYYFAPSLNALNELAGPDSRPDVARAGGPPPHGWGAPYRVTTNFRAWIGVNTTPLRPWLTRQRPRRSLSG
jgi:hypothetical protein